MQPLPSKNEVALALLERSSVYVHLDPRRDGVAVPAWFKNQPQLVLQVGTSMPVPIPDLRLDEGGMTCTLSFNRTPLFCVVPWSSVFAMVGEDGRGMVWPDEVPAEVAREARSSADQAIRPGTPPEAESPHDSEWQTGEATGSCSFCGKSRPEVKVLLQSDGARERKGFDADDGAPVNWSSGSRVDGPSVSICNECIDLCKEIVTQEGAKRSAAVRVEGFDPDAADRRARSSSANEQAGDLIGQETLELIKQANKLHGIVAELGATLSRYEHEHAQATRQPLAAQAQSSPDMNPDGEKGHSPTYSTSKLGQLSTLMSRHRASLDKADRDWNRAFSLALNSLVERSGLEGRSPRSGESSPPAAARSLSCSFCGKPERAAENMIAGPTVYICSECVRSADQATRT